MNTYKITFSEQLENRIGKNNFVEIAEILLAKLMETPNIAVKFENVDNLEDFIEQYNFSSLGINSKKAIILFKGEEIFNITNDWDDHEYYKVHHKKRLF